MYRIDKDENRLIPFDKKKLIDFGFNERFHLQEWLANEPSAFGENLLIIQKEFSWLDVTNGRVDLLALDKKGYLVIIELKRDRSGKDIAGKAVSYASFFRKANAKQIVSIFQMYLDKYYRGKDAAKLICEFLEVPDLSQIAIKGEQRIILVADNFAKEAISSVLFLLDYNVRVQCFRTVIFGNKDNPIFQLEQILPGRDVSAYEIGINDYVPSTIISELESVPICDDLECKISIVEGGTVEFGKMKLYDIRQSFLNQVLKSLQASNSRIFDNVGVGVDGLISGSSDVSGCRHRLVLAKKELRIELQILRSSKVENKFIYSQLFKNKYQIETAFGNELQWDKRSAGQGSYIRYKLEVDTYNSHNWPSMIDWLLKYMIKLESSLKNFLTNAYEKLAISNRYNG